MNTQIFFVVFLDFVTVKCELDFLSTMHIVLVIGSGLACFELKINPYFSFFMSSPSIFCQSTCQPRHR
jgi:hypothetical protein